MLFISDVHTVNEWLALLDRDTYQVQQYASALRTRIAKLGIAADSDLSDSLAAYHLAEQLHANASIDPHYHTQLRQRIAQGQASLTLYPDCLQWLALIRRSQSSELQLPFPETPTVHEWVALIRHDADAAYQAAQLLQTRAIDFDRFLRDPYTDSIEDFKQNKHLHVGPAHYLSIQEYEAAQQLVSALADDLQQAELISLILSLGRATLTAYPDKNDWSTLHQADPVFTRKLATDLECKRTILGLLAPWPLDMSIAAYHSLRQQSNQA